MTSDPRRDPRLPKDWPRVRPPDRVMLVRVSPRRRAVANLLIYGPPLALALLLLALGVPDPIPILAGVGILLIIFLLERTGLRSREAQLAADDARADEIAADFGSGLVLRRRFPFGWPLACVITLLLFSFIGWQSGLPPLAVAMIIGLLLVACGVTLIALRNSGEFGRLSTDGIELGGRTFRWRHVRSIEPQYVFGLNWRYSSYWLRLSLVDALTTESLPRGGYWQFRRGRDAHELLVSMKRTSESPAVIYQLAEQLWARERERALTARR